MTNAGHGVGGVGEEAARLLEAVQDWARRTAGAGDGTGQAEDSPWLGRIGSDALECQLCPLCRLIAVVRNTRPEVVEHLADATSSLAAAIRELLAASQHERTGPGAVERIDIG